MITLIGSTCTHRKVFSGGVLIDRTFPSLVREEFENRNNLLFVFTLIRQLADLDPVLWWFNGGATPVLIPNTEVKLASGDGTALYRAGE